MVNLRYLPKSLVFSWLVHVSTLHDVAKNMKVLKSIEARLAQLKWAELRPTGKNRAFYWYRKYGGSHQARHHWNTKKWPGWWDSRGGLWEFQEDCGFFLTPWNQQPRPTSHVYSIFKWCCEQPFRTTTNEGEVPLNQLKPGWLCPASARHLEISGCHLQWWKLRVTNVILRSTLRH